MTPEARDREAAGIGAWAEGRRAAGEAAPSREPRSVAEGGTVELHEVTRETVRAVSLLQVAEGQRGLVAPNAVSFAEAMFEPKAWFRAIVIDGVPVGFVMLSIDTETAEYYLWRFMVDERYQGRGYGRAAIELVVEHVRALPGATQLLVSWVPGPGGPERFYRALGFRSTGAVEDDEVVASLPL